MQLTRLLVAAGLAARGLCEVAVAFDAPEVLHNEVPEPFVFTFTSSEPAPLKIREVTAVLRKPKTNKVHLNLTQPFVAEVPVGGQGASVAYSRVYSVPTQAYNLQYVFEYSVGDSDEALFVATEPALVTAVDPRIEWWDPRLSVSAVVVVVMLAIVAFLAHEYVPAVSEFVAQYRPKSKPQATAAPVPQRSEPATSSEDWLPERHRRKTKKQ